MYDGQANGTMAGGFPNTWCGSGQGRQLSCTSHRGAQGQPSCNSQQSCVRLPLRYPLNPGYNTTATHQALMQAVLFLNWVTIPGTWCGYNWAVRRW